MKTTTKFEKVLKEFDGKPILYIMHAPGTNRWKIGITNNVRERWYSIHSQSPIDVSVYKIFIFDSRDIAEKIELQFKQQNQKIFVKGEWYACDFQDIIQLEDTILEYQYCHYIDRGLYEHTIRAYHKTIL